MVFIRIKNKYCVICQKSATKNEITPKRECFMNWTKSSTSIEPDGVVEGFMNSITMHGLKYNRLIGNFLNKCFFQMVLDFKSYYNLYIIYFILIIKSILFFKQIHF